MTPVAILATNTNPDYLSCLPIVCKTWELQGYATDVTIVKSLDNQAQIDAAVKYCPASANIRFENDCPLPSVNNALYVQCIRLYRPLNLADEQVFVISDIDMLIASSFLNRDFDKVNSFGWDLTGFGETPMCYISCTAGKWKGIMGNATMQQDLDTYGQQHSEDWYKAWGCDQMILTAKLKAYGHDKINFINRGHDNNNAGLPMGRWDRYNLKKPAGEIHDVHLMRDPLSDNNFGKLVEICQTIYPNENWSWLTEYKSEFNGR
jgi:hypothetical protein